MFHRRHLDLFADQGNVEGIGLFSVPDRQFDRCSGFAAHLLDGVIEADSDNRFAIDMGDEIAGLDIGACGRGTYTLTCTGTGGTSAPTSATVTVTTGITPTATVSANPTTIDPGGSSMLTWSSTNASSCTASGTATGTEATSGTLSVSPTATTTYTLTCTGLVAQARPPAQR